MIKLLLDDYKFAYIRLCHQVNERMVPHLDQITDASFFFEYNRVLGKYGCMLFTEF